MADSTTVLLAFEGQFKVLGILEDAKVVWLDGYETVLNSAVNEHPNVAQ